MTTTSTTSATSGVLQSLGIGSGIDVNSLVTQLVTADTQADTARLTRQTQQVATQLSAVGQLKGALATFQSALNSLNTTDDFQAKSATSGDEDVFTVSAGPSAAAGTYQVQIESLAQSQQLKSTVIAGDGTATVGTGSLTLTLGDKSFTVTIDDAHDSLNAIRDAINSASGNPGIGATIVHGDGTSQLILSSNQTGAANTITVTADGGDGGLGSLTYGLGNTSHYTELQGAQDSLVKVAGVSFTSAKNTVTGAIDGVTLNLLDSKPGTAITLKVANDLGTVTNRIQSFVSAYNTLQSVVTKLGGYDAASQTAGTLLGDALLDGISSQTRRLLSNPVASATSQYTTLASLGITTNRDGTLSLDTDKLSTILSTNFSAVSNVFGATDGVATKLSKFIDAQLASGAGIDARNKTFATQQKQITDQQAVLTARQQKIKDRYTAQFTAMDTILSQLQTTSSFLTQQFASLAKSTSSG